VIQVHSIEEAERHLESLTVRVDELERRVSDHAQRFDTLQTTLWRRILFRLDGWPGRRNLNAERRAWRPWH
jgi:hypothetical protein